MHLAIDAEQRAVGVENRGGIVIKTGGAALKERSDDHDAQLARQLAQRFGRGPGDRLGEVEAVVIFLAAEILRAEQLLQADDLRAEFGGLANTAHRRGQVFPGIERAFSLDQPDGEFLRHESDTTIPRRECNAERV